MTSRITQLLTRYVSAGLLLITGYSASGNEAQVDVTTQAVVTGILALLGFAADQFLHSKLFREKP